jgi:hypothetical protein
VDFVSAHFFEPIHILGIVQVERPADDARLDVAAHHGTVPVDETASWLSDHASRLVSRAGRVREIVTIAAQHLSKEHAGARVRSAAAVAREATTSGEPGRRAEDDVVTLIERVLEGGQHALSASVVLRFVPLSSFARQISGVVLHPLELQSIRSVVETVPTASVDEMPAAG